MKNQHDLVLRYVLVILSRFEKTLQTTKSKRPNEKTNYNELNYWQLKMNAYNKKWLPTTTRETTTNSKGLKIFSKKLTITKNITKLNYWLFKNEITRSKQQNNSWTVEWLMIATLLVVEESPLLTISKISYILVQHYCDM